jgi:hypothetical protein
MKRLKNSSDRKGSSLITVVLVLFVMAMLTGSILRYSGNEMRGNERNRLALRAKNVAENISIYAAEQLTGKLFSMGTAPVGYFPYSGTSTSRVYMPPDSGILLSEYNTSSSSMEMRCAIEAATPYATVTDTTNTNYGLQVATAKVPIIAKGTATLPAIGTMTAYVEQDMELALVPLFQFGLFYNMDLEFFPGQNMTIMGPVHTNGRLTARGEQGGTATITFTDRVTAALGLYADGQMKANYIVRSGSTSAGAGGSGAVTYTSVANVQTNLYSSSLNIWRDHKYGTASETPSTQNQFKTFTTTTYGGNVRTNAHGTDLELKLPGIGSYAEVDDPATSVDERDSGRQIIEPRNPYKWNGSTWAATTDDTAAADLKLARKCGLYIIVNPDDTARIGKLPDGTDQPILARSYRCWLNRINSDGSHTLSEVVLPGQPTFGYYNGGTAGTTTALIADDLVYRNYLPNRFTQATSIGSNQVLKIPQQYYGTGSGYLMNGAQVIGATSLNIDTGTGTILAGDSVTIGAYRYLVSTELTGAGALKLASADGLRANVADNTAVTIDSSNTPLSTGTGYQMNGAHAIGATALTIDTGAGSILPGNVITIAGSTHKYLVTAATVATPHTTVWLAAPGLRAAVLNNAAVAIDGLTGTLGTGINYQINNAGGYAVGYGSVNPVNIDQGTGTIIPGNTLYLGGQRYIVTSTSGAAPHTWVTITPNLSVALADNDLVHMDPYDHTGYLTNGNGGTTDDFPAEASATPYPGEAFFFDLRRANGNVGYNSNIAGGTARGTTNYVPRAIAKIDFDMTRFKLAVNRTFSSSVTSTIYDPSMPTATNWAASIFNSGATAAAYGLGMDADSVTPWTYNVFPGAANTGDMNRPDPFMIYFAPPIDVTTHLPTYPADVRTLAVTAADLSAAWYDGLSIYVHSVDAERRAQTIVAGKNDRVDSGVRLINGRGPVISFGSLGDTGFTFVTNDAAYIIGHFNADGSVNATSTATGNGGYSARYPDTANEKLTAVMADAVTLLSQPVFTNGTAPYSQTNGWNDAVSAFRVTTSSWSSSWRSTAPGGSNNFEGLGSSATDIRPGSLPTNSTPATAGAPTRDTKLPTDDTEFSVALLVGIVPSNHNATGQTDRPPLAAANAQYSGGAHNYPRLLEDWHNDMGSGNNSGLFIRGSMVALFESRVAMEPWNIRCYQAPNRYWGLHEGFRTAGHDLPLEPIVLSATRLGFRELSASEYATRKTTIQAMTAIP